MGWFNEIIKLFAKHTAAIGKVGIVVMARGYNRLTPGNYTQVLYESRSDFLSSAVFKNNLYKKYSCQTCFQPDPIKDPRGFEKFRKKILKTKKCIFFLDFWISLEKNPIPRIWGFWNFAFDIFWEKELPNFRDLRFGFGTSKKIQSQSQICL